MNDSERRPPARGNSRMKTNCFLTGRPFLVRDNALFYGWAEILKPAEKDEHA